MHSAKTKTNTHHTHITSASIWESTKSQKETCSACLATMGQVQAKEDAEDAPVPLVMRLPKESGGNVTQQERRHKVAHTLSSTLTDESQLVRCNSVLLFADLKQLLMITLRPPPPPSLQ